MSFSGTYSLVTPLPLDHSSHFRDSDMEAPLPSNQSSLRIPRRPVSSGASTTSTSSLLNHAASPSGTTIPLHNFDINNVFATKFDRHRHLYGTITGFVNHGYIGEAGKKIYNTLFTALSMILGISIASSFKAMALNLRWYILSRKKRPIEEANAILGCSSLTEVSLLAAKSAKKMKPGLALSCSLWVLFNIGGQAAVAMLSLTVSLNPYRFENASHPITGPVVFSNLTQSFANGFDTDSIEASQLAAHTFGEVALQYTSVNLSSSDPNAFPQLDSVYFLAPIQQSTYYTPLYFNDSENSYLQYVFQETDENYTLGYLYSNRSITVTSECMVYSVTDNLNGSLQYFQYDKDGGIETQNFSSVAPNSTTYFTQPYGGDCGPHCANVCAYENNGSKGWYYECTITVSNVTNTAVYQQRVNDSNAKMAAGAIALQGYQAKALDSQYQRYPAKSSYGHFLDGDNAAMAYNMRKFAIGVLAAADQSLSDIDPNILTVDGSLPAVGLVQWLSIDHLKGMYAILGGILGCHFVLLVFGTWIANKVVVVDDDYLAIALLLRPVAEEMKGKGALLDKERREKLGRNMEVIFGPKLNEKSEVGRDGTSQLEIGTDAEQQLYSKGWDRYFDS
ncbi:hypothetical protein V8E51_001485 [Hyaloscypha variabilis]